MASRILAAERRELHKINLRAATHIKLADM